VDDPAKRKEVSEEHGSQQQKETVSAEVEDLEPSDSEAASVKGGEGVPPVKGGQVTPLVEP
jgi:hypothetical protein